MKELLNFVEQQILLNMFIGLTNGENSNGVMEYTVDYWVPETIIEDGEEVEVLNGKQKIFTL